MTDVPDPTVEAVVEEAIRKAVQEECGFVFQNRKLYTVMARAAVAVLAQPDRTFVDDLNRRWEWCGGVEGTWAWRVTAVYEGEAPPAWVTRPVKDGKPDISAMDAADFAEWQETERRAAEIARTTFDRKEEK